MEINVQLRAFELPCSNGALCKVLTGGVQRTIFESLKSTLGVELSSSQLIEQHQAAFFNGKGVFRGQINLRRVAYEDVSRYENYLSLNRYFTLTCFKTS